MLERNNMPIRVKIEKVVEEFWGAEECLKQNGLDALKEMLHEDLNALVKDADIKIYIDDSVNPKEIKEDNDYWKKRYVKAENALSAIVQKFPQTYSVTGATQKEIEVANIARDALVNTGDVK